MFPEFPELPGVRFAHIVGFPGYAVSSDGRVWSCLRTGPVKNKIAGQWKQRKAGHNQSGHMMVRLRKGCRYRSFTVSHLVLSAFVGPKPKPTHYAHMDDGNKNNCHIDNLSWRSFVELNQNHKMRPHLCRGEDHPMSKLTAAKVRKIKTALSAHQSMYGLAKQYGVSAETIGQIRDGKSWRCVAFPSA